MGLDGRHLFVKAPHLDSDGSSVANDSVADAGGLLYLRLDTSFDNATFHTLLVAPAPTALAEGWSVAAGNDVVIYNQWAINSGAGAVSLSRWNGTAWAAPIDVTLAPDAGDHFGGAITVDETFYVACSPHEDGAVSGVMGVGGDPGDDSGVDTGACFVFRL